MDPSKTNFPRLSSPSADIKPHYDVVVVGSGYGGSIAACRSASAGKSVCLLEKGKEWLPGEFPESFVHAEKDLQIHFGDHRFHKGMFSTLDKLRLMFTNTRSSTPTLIYFLCEFD